LPASSQNADPPRSDAAPADAGSSSTAAIGGEEQPPASGALPISIPGLVIAD
jgi:hypothetical protein